MDWAWGGSPAASEPHMVTSQSQDALNPRMRRASACAGLRLPQMGAPRVANIRGPKHGSLPDPRTVGMGSAIKRLHKVQQDERFSHCLWHVFHVLTLALPCLPN